jgi:hypothetical protein
MNARRRNRRPTIYLGAGIPAEVGSIFRRHHFEVVALEDRPELLSGDEETLLASLYQANGILVTQDLLLYTALVRSQPHVQHAGVAIMPASYSAEQIVSLTHLIARWYRAATISSPFGGRNRLLYPGMDGLRVLDTTADIGTRDQLSFPWTWWEINDDQVQA